MREGLPTCCRISRTHCTPWNRSRRRNSFLQIPGPTRMSARDNSTRSEDDVRCPGWGPPAAEERGERPWRRRRGALGLLESDVIGLFGKRFGGEGVVPALGEGVVRAFEIRGSMFDVRWIGRVWSAPTLDDDGCPRFGWGCCRPVAPAPRQALPAAEGPAPHNTCPSPAQLSLQRHVTTL